MIKILKKYHYYCQICRVKIQRSLLQFCFLSFSDDARDPRNSFREEPQPSFLGLSFLGPLGSRSLRKFHSVIDWERVNNLNLYMMGHSVFNTDWKSLKFINSRKSSIGIFPSVDMF